MGEARDNRSDPVHYRAPPPFPPDLCFFVFVVILEAFWVFWDEAFGFFGFFGYSRSFLGV